MLISRCLITTRIPLTAFVSGIGKQTFKPNISYQKSRIQQYASEAKSGLSRRAEKRSLKEMAMAPAGESAFKVGRGVVAGASVVGIGALCYYGLGMSNELGAIDRSIMWSAEVKGRIRDTYMYFGGSVAITVMSAVSVFRNPRIMAMMMKNSWMAIGATFAAMIGTGMLCRSIEYTEGFGAKQLAWILHSGVIGAVIAPISLLGGPLLVRAAWYTAGVVGGLSAVAMCAPSEKFLNMGGPLAIGLGVVFASSIGGMFLPPSTALGAGLYSISIYGGLVLFSFFLLYDTQKIIQKAENHPTYAVRKYDPINGSIGIYMDTINIFMRIAMILSGGGGGRRK
ncbi:growth hormone-inducible transmembrane protein [Patella vulgata]|uniref:growth hormone-inducible transmembrane protein n=1 Tax=Patella vulgata TaxID=6465 RepID=UPI0021800A4D|nr:growth hormone-inducible transmembrane protein [Patella vulgata]